MEPTGSWALAASGAMLLGADGSLRPTIFAEMSALAASSGAINLGQGFPDEDGPRAVLDAAKAAIDAGLNQYPPGLGMPVLRSAIAAHQERFYGILLDPDREVLVTAGATEAIAATILALTEPGDEVVTLEPFYDSYGAMISYARTRHVTVPLRWPDFRPDPDDLRAAISDRTRLIVLNSPHNPSGAVLDAATLELIVELAERHDAYIMTDEVYEHLVFDGRHIPPASLPGARSRTVSISSGGKTFNTTGWKVGWVTAPHELIERIVAVKQFLTFVNAAPFQPAIAVGLALPDEYFSHAAEVLRDKRDLLSAGLREAGFDVATPAAGYFVLADAAPLGVTDAADFCRRLPALAGVAGIPVSALVGEASRKDYRSLVRFAFCKRHDVLAEAASRLASLTPARAAGAG
jgi:N-succinyldiaminopimelate aminotransferase